MWKQSESENKGRNEISQFVKVQHPVNNCFAISSDENQFQHNIAALRPQAFTCDDSISGLAGNMRFASSNLPHTIRNDNKPHLHPSQDSSTIDLPPELFSSPYMAGNGVASRVLTANCQTASQLNVLAPDISYSSHEGHNHGQCGLHNLGNTCFMNSILQCLNNVPPLVEHYLDPHHRARLSGNKHRVSTAFANLTESMRKHDTVRPTALKAALSKYAPLFRGYSQQDSHEYLTLLLDALHQESSTEGKDGEERSIVTDIFQGQMEYTIKCSEASRCKNITVTIDPFLDIPVFIKEMICSSYSPEVIVSAHDGEARQNSSALLDIWSHAKTWLRWAWTPLKKCGTFMKNRLDNFSWLVFYIIMRICFLFNHQWRYGVFGSFYQIVPTSAPENSHPTCAGMTLEQYLKINITVVERMSSNSTWFCSHCQHDQQLTKENHILSLPQVLIIHLKRFNMEARQTHRTKIETFVKYPLELNMATFIKSATSCDKYMYDLIGVCLHSGSFEKGHYTAYTKKTSGWFRFNDSSVDPISVNEVINRNAYILFYLRRD